MSNAHRGDRFVMGDLENTLHVLVTNGLKPVCPTKMLDDKTPHWAKVVTILERLLLCG
jgi:hypothetical protein